MGYIGQTPTAVPLSADDLVDGIITEAKLGTGAITEAKLGTGAVTNVKVGTGIDSAKIGAGDVSNTEHAFLNSITSNVQTQISGAGGQYAISTGSLDVSSASATTITGVSFTPKYATFLGSVDGSSAAAWGISLTGSTDYHIYDAHQAADGDYATGSLFANLQTGGSDVLQIFCALTSDGASLTKNVIGSPSGTLYYHITFFG